MRRLTERLSTRSLFSVVLIPAVLLIMGMDESSETKESALVPPPLREGPRAFPDDNPQDEVDPLVCEHEWTYSKPKFFYGTVTATCSLIRDGLSMT